MLMSTTTLADVTSRACVINGSTLSIGGRRAYNRCNGGGPVRLYGIDTPELAQICHDSNGRSWPCGRLAAASLLEMVQGCTLKHRGNSTDDKEKLIAIYFVDHVDINCAIARKGEDMYQSEETATHDVRIDLWQRSFEAE